MVDLFHALLMAAWLLGLPLLFWHRWPRTTRLYAIYAVLFVVVNALSNALIGECFITTLSRACWGRASGGTPVSHEWFTVRLAEAIFRLSPSHAAVKVVSKVLVLVTAIGALTSLRHLRYVSHRHAPRPT
jgi:hypothetical protein